MPKHDQGVVSVDKIIGSRTARSDADREHEARPAGREECLHTLLGQANPSQPGPALKETLIGS